MTGSYSVLLKPGKRFQDIPLVLRLVREPIGNPQPDVISMARWLHFRFAEAGMPRVRVMTYSVLAEEVSSDYFDDVLVRKPKSWRLFQ